MRGGGGRWTTDAQREDKESYQHNDRTFPPLEYNIRARWQIVTNTVRSLNFDIAYVAFASRLNYSLSLSPFSTVLDTLWQLLCRAALGLIFRGWPPCWFVPAKIAVTKVKCSF